MDRDSHPRTPNDPYRPAIWQEDWRDRSGMTTTHTEPTEARTQTTPFPPYYDMMSGRSKMGAAASHFDITNIPKYWNPPLTCFYWHTYGHCNKSDADCLYAHYNTGIVASAPFAMTEGHAGRNAMGHFNEYRIKQRELEDREARLVAREKQLEDRVALLLAGEKEMTNIYAVYKSTQASDHVVRGIYEVVDETKAALNEAFDTLSRRTYKPKAEKVVDPADNATGDIANAIVRLQRVKVKAESKFGRPVPLSKSV